MKYIIVGAGWYGCHIASYLLRENKEVIIIDKANDLFTGSSSKNQNRLHLGFHYPRSIETIEECKRGYTKFVNTYPQLVRSIPNNTYYISKVGSRISINEFIKNIDKYELDYEICDTMKIYNPLHIKGLEDKCFNTNELYIDHKNAYIHFKSILSEYLRKDIPDHIFKSVEYIKDYFDLDSNDMLINCTYNHLNPIECDTYELYLSLIYRIENIDTFAITIMDGPFFSIYPYDIENKLYTVTSVEHGVVYRGKQIVASEIRYDKFTESRGQIEALLDEYMDNWREHLVYVDYNLSWKTKPLTITDDRSVRIHRDDNVINIYGGKITGIFEAEKYIESILLKDSYN